MRQMKGCGKSSDRHHFTVDLQIRGSGVSEDTTFLNRLAFHGLQIITGCGKAQDGAFLRMGCFRGCSVSRSRLAFHSQSKNQRLRQMKGCGKSSDRHHFTVDLQIRGCGIKNNSCLIYAIGMQNTATSRIKQADN